MVSPMPSASSTAMAADDQMNKVVDGVTFEVRAGEVLGIAGVQGNGQTQLVEALTGLRKVVSGQFSINGQDCANASSRRITELGILRAVGLSKNTMMISVAWELGLLIISGLGLGIVLGLTVSGMYIPYLQFSTDRSPLVPPYVVEIAWSEIAQITGLFLVTFVAILIVLLVVLRRMRIFEAVKLGESV